MTELWLPVSDAASRLGVSAQTIARRVKRGKLQGRKTNSGKEILLENGQDNGAHAPETAKAVHIGDNGAAPPATNGTPARRDDAFSAVSEHQKRQVELTSRIAEAYEAPIRRAEEDAQNARWMLKRVWGACGAIGLLAFCMFWFALRAQSALRVEQARSEFLLSRLGDAKADIDWTRENLSGMQTRLDTERTRADNYANEAVESHAERMDLMTVIEALRYQMSSLERQLSAPQAALTSASHKDGGSEARR